MFYIKLVDDVVDGTDDIGAEKMQRVVVAGQVATQEMLDDGYFKYLETIPDGDTFTWNMATQKMVSVLDSIRHERKLEVKADYEQRLSLGFTTFNSITMDADVSSIQLLKSGLDLAIMLGSENTGDVMDVRDYYNITHPALPMDTINDMIKQLAVNYKTELGRKWYLETSIDNATTVAEINGIVI